MRLVCPNCEAKYEVPEDAIPETGRDVQCANCGHAWYQMRSRAAASDVAAAAVAPVAATPPSVSEPAPVPVPAPAVEPEPVPVVETPAAAVAPLTESAEVAIVEEPVRELEPDSATEPAPEPEAERLAADSGAVETSSETPVSEVVSDPVAEPAPEATPQEAATEGATEAVETASVTDTAAEDESASVSPAAAAAPAAYAVDESVLAILREEAAREARAREAEAAKPLEVQPDLGIDQAMPVSARVAEVAAEDPGLAARRARLPDVEEINSTLRPSDVVEDEAMPGAPPVAVEGGSSFRSGFLLVLSVAILGSAIYGSADVIAEVVPSLAGPLKSYVGFVDSLRLQLDGLMQSATVAINGG